MAQKAQRGVAAEKIPEKVLILAFNQKRAFHVHNPHSVCPLNITAVNLLMKLTGRHVLMSECEKIFAPSLLKTMVVWSK